MVMEQWFSPSKAVLVFILATFTGGLSSTAVANLPAGAVIRATPGIVYINITGNVIAPPPCLINDGKMIEVMMAQQPLLSIKEKSPYLKRSFYLVKVKEQEIKIKTTSDKE